MRPGIFALRALNQYRRRDIVTYLGLRYYLSALAARSDKWADEVAIDLTQHRLTRPYLISQMFKETDSDGMQIFRELETPAPNECLSEAALLAECARVRGPFEPLDSVFSYMFADSGDTAGVFRPYFIGFRDRHAAIARASRCLADGIVVYRDIRRFYPSISTSLAHRAWSAACDATGLGKRYIELGERLLADYHRAQHSAHQGVITGPMLSHLIGNLVLRDFDQRMADQYPARYFRYVDDMVFIIPARELLMLQSRLEGELGELGFSLHPTKGFEVPCGRWLSAENDLAAESSPSWASLVGGMKQLLVTKPECRSRLENLFFSKEIRFVPLDYLKAAGEIRHVRRFQELLRFRWFRRKVRLITPEQILEMALRLRDRYQRDFEFQLQRPLGGHPFERKRILQRLRYLCGRLIYLAEPDRVAVYADHLSQIPEMNEFAVIFRCIASRDATELISYSGRAAQAAAQPLRSLRDPIRLNVTTWDEPRIEGASVLALNGVPLTRDATLPPVSSPLAAFALGEGNPDAHSAFFDELFILAGKPSRERHAEILSSALDVDERLAFDTELLGESS